MIVFLGFMVAITLVLKFAPNSAAGKVLSRQLVERPLDELSRVKRHHLFFFVIVLGFAAAGGEAMAILGPDIFTAYAVDLAIYLDAVLVTYALSAIATMRRGGEVLKAPLLRVWRKQRPRRRRAVLRRSDSKPSNDDDPALASMAA